MTIIPYYSPEIDQNPVNRYVLILPLTKFCVLICHLYSNSCINLLFTYFLINLLSYAYGHLWFLSQLQTTDPYATKILASLSNK